MQTNAPRLTEASKLDERIRTAHTQLRRAERELALLLAQMASGGLFLDLGHASIHDYARTTLQLEDRKTRALLRIGRALPELPRLDRALASGALGWTKARELLSVVTPENEEAWVELARRSTNRELERSVAAHRPGEEPSDAEIRPSGPVRLVLSMEPCEAEQLRAALAALRSSTGVSRDEMGDGALLAQAAARVLHDMEGPEVPTGERFRIVIEHCPRCGDSSAAEAEVSDTHVGQALCDAEILDMRPGPQRGHVSRTIPPATRRAVLQRDKHRCQVPGCSNRLWLDIHHLHYWRNGGSNAEGNLLTVCGVHHGLIHDGRLGVEPCEGGLIFHFPDGRKIRTTHVGSNTPVDRSRGEGRPGQRRSGRGAGARPARSRRGGSGSEAGAWRAHGAGRADGHGLSASDPPGQR